jgi:hypothetical protein
MAIIDFFDRGWRINPDGVAYVQDDLTHTFSATDLAARESGSAPRPPCG